MKFSANRSTLVEALTVTGKAINTINILPILSSYLFKIKNDRVEITGGSMDIFIKNTIEIPPSELNLAIAIPKNKILDLIKDSPNQLIDFDILQNNDLETDKAITNLKITTTLGEYLIPIEPGEDYPYMKIENPKHFSITQENLLSGTDRTVFACGNDSLKVELTGVYMKLVADKIEFAGANGSIISCMSFPVETKDTIENAFIVPQKVLTIIQGMPMEEQVEVMVTDRHIKFDLSSDVSVEAMLVDGKYPDHHSFVPTDLPYHLHIRRSMITGSIKRVVRFSDYDNMVVLEISPNNCKISSKNDFGDKAEENLTIIHKNGDVRIGMSGELLLKAFNRMAADNIMISFSGPSNAMVLRDSEDSAVVNTVENMICIGPMRLDD